jgi:hypothetical protein
MKLRGCAMARFIGAALLLSASLVGCGGADPAGPAAAKPQQAIAVTPALGADDLMGVAEVRYYQYFPGPAVTQHSGPFAYRYYAVTGTYLGVVVAQDPQYVMGGVYVMGGAFGATPMYVGAMADFLNLVDLSAGGTDNGCGSPADDNLPGTTVVLTDAYTGLAGPGVNITTSVVVGTVTFQGHVATAVDNVQSDSFTRSGVEYNRTYSTRSYSAVTGAGEVTHYGWTSSESGTTPGGLPSTSTTTAVFSPVLVDDQYRMQPGQSIAFTQTSNETVLTSINGGPVQGQIDTYTYKQIITYLGRETVTVPAGTFETCKYEVILPAVPVTSPYGSLETRWVAVGTGQSVQSTIDVPGSGYPLSVHKATALTRNGQPI